MTEEKGLNRQICILRWSGTCLCVCHMFKHVVFLCFSALSRSTSSCTSDVRTNNSWTWTSSPGQWSGSSTIRTTTSGQMTTTYLCCSCPHLLSSPTTSDRCVWRRQTASSMPGRLPGSPDGEPSELAVRLVQSFLHLLLFVVVFSEQLQHKTQWLKGTTTGATDSYWHRTLCLIKRSFLLKKKCPFKPSWFIFPL